MGQPRKVHWQAGLATGGIFDRSSDELVVRAHVAATRHLANPIAGLGSISLEGYLGARAVGADGGARIVLPVPYFGIGPGIDYNLRDGRLAALITFHSPIRRGGIVAPGGMARGDWYPTRRHSFTLGVSVPIGDPLIGRGRPIRDHVVVAADFQPRVRYSVRDAQLDAVLDSMDSSAEWIRRLVVPFLDQDGRNARIAQQRTEQYVRELQRHVASRSVEQEVRHFHAQLEHAFVLAAGGDGAGQKVARAAREILLDEVILPYNRLLGRKKRHDTLHDLSTAARRRFSRWVTASASVPPERADHVLFVFQQLTQLMDGVRRAAAKEWDDARLVWLPLQYALLPEEHADKADLDKLVERATGLRFSNGNRVQYVANLQFHWELLKTIRETRDYHVLWIHDFPSLTSEGTYDWAAIAQVADGYLATLAERVEAYDAKGTLPTFFIFIDQMYYEANQSRLLMSVLEDPLGATLQRRGAANTAVLASAQERLRTAVHASRVLNAEARQYGEAWLRNRIKVHVNVTNRPDASFWSGSLVATMFGYPDNVMRDHRKIAFRDVTESDPSAGTAILTGTGVGQKYLGPSWEDRSLIVQGPVLLELKRAARELLLSQGMREHDIPFGLRSGTNVTGEGPPAGNSGAEFDSHAMLLVNGTGYLPKPLNVAKAVLYSLLPPGSSAKIPDSLWNSSFYAGLLTGACLRGAHVSVVAPALANAPSRGFPQMERARELMLRLLIVQRELAEAMHATKGELRVGLYAIGGNQDGFGSRAALWANQMANEPSLRALMPFAGDLSPLVAAAATTELSRKSGQPTDRSGATTLEAPQLHMKVQVFITRELRENLAHSPEWPEFMSTYLKYREATYMATGSVADAQRMEEQLARTAERLLQQAGGESAGASYALVGSQNQDYRGMFMDGEVGVLFTGFQSLVPILDLAFLEGTVTWLTDEKTLDRLLPPMGEMKRRFARVAKDAL